MESIGIFIGRLQPITVMHQRIITNMDQDKVYVVIIEGIKTSSEPKNFLTLKDRIDLLKITNPNAKVIYSREGYIPDIIEQQKLNPNNDDVYIVAGTDRIDGYMIQFKKIKGYTAIKKEIPRMPEDISATKIRQALIDNDYLTYKRMIAKGLDNERYFSWFQKKLKARMVTEGIWRY